LGAINSINWARVLAQITYYFYSWLRVTDGVGTDKSTKLNFVVPTGNFGDILAGYYAKRMGIPIDKLVIATNDNDVLHRFLKSGVYQRNPAVVTIAPSMDISVSSNFERYLFYLTGESGETLKSWMREFESTGKVAASADALKVANSEFLSYATNEAEIVSTMRSVWKKDSYLVCPHTATAVAAIKALKLPSSTTVCLATAHPAKFEEAVTKAVKDLSPPARPYELTELFSLPCRSYNLPNSLRDVESFVRKLVSRKKSGWTSSVSTLVLSAVGVALIAMAVTVVFSLERARKSR